MGITQECDYALRVVLFLSEKPTKEKVEARIISENLNIPLRFLLKLLRKLSIAGILNSFRGVGGGYILAKNPEDITLKEVIEIIDGPIYVNRCLYDTAYCTMKRTQTCNIHHVLDGIQSRMEADLLRINFKNIIEGEIN